MTQRAPIILGLQLGQKVMKLKGNLSSPRTGLGMDREEMAQELGRLIVASTCHTSGFESMYDRSICPELGKIPGNQRGNHPLCQCFIP